MPWPRLVRRISCSKGVVSGRTGWWGERAWLKSHNANPNKFKMLNFFIIFIKNDGARIRFTD
jgi:hypothetical protein